MELTGYSDRWSVRPGEEIAFHVHCAARHYDAQLVRLRHGDESPRGPGFREIEVASPLDGGHAGAPRTIRKGSYGVAPLGDLLAGHARVVLTVSMDLPFAQKRWCGTHGIERVLTLSDYKHRDVGTKFGLRMRENGLLARAVYVIDSKGVIRYEQIVKEIATEPDYDAVLAVANDVAQHAVK